MFKDKELIKIELLRNNFQKEMTLIAGLTFRLFFSVLSLLFPVLPGKNFNLGYRPNPFIKGITSVIGRSFISFCCTPAYGITESQMCSETDTLRQGTEICLQASPLQEAAQCSGWGLAVQGATVFVLMPSGSPH